MLFVRYIPHYKKWGNGMGDEIKLTIEIQNKQPVELIDLAQVMLSTAAEYRSYISTHAIDVDPQNTRLYIKEVRSGSVITELVAMAPYALPLVEHADSILKYGKYVVAGLSWFMGRGEKPADEYGRKTLENLNTILEPIAKDRGSQLVLTGNTFNGDVSFVFNIDSPGANAAQNSIRKELDATKPPIVGIHSQVVMYWAQARNQPNSKSGDRARIESIYRGDVKILFANDGLKAKMLYDTPFPFTKAFLVDVAVETVDEKPILYKVTELYDVLDRGEFSST